jgi:hypothetical protein
LTILAFEEKNLAVFGCQYGCVDESNDIFEYVRSEASACNGGLCVSFLEDLK